MGVTVSQLATKIVIEGATQAKSDLVAMDANSRLAQAGMKMLQNASRDALSERLSAEIHNADGGLRDLAARANAAGLDISKLSTFQAKATESAAKLGVAESQYASAQQKANELVQSGTASAEQIALAQSKAALSAEKVNVAENAVYVAMEKVNTESNRLNIALRENASAAVSTSSAMDIVKSAMANVGTGMESAINWMSDFASKAVSSAGEFISSFNSVSEEMSVVEAKSQESIGGGLLSNLKSAGGGLLDFASKAGFALMGVQMFVQGAMQIGEALIGPNASMEQTTVAFTSIFHSSEKARLEMEKLKKFAADTPFEFPELADADQKLLAFQFSAKDTLPIMTAIGDALSALGKSTPAYLDQVVNVFGQMKANGKIATQDMMQLTSVGINGFQILAESMGKTVPQIKQMITDGLIPADKGIELLRQGMEKTFGGGMQAQSQTFNGLLSTLKDNAMAALRAFTSPLFDAAKSALRVLGDLVSAPAFQNFAEGAGKRIGEAFGKIGSVVSSIVSPAISAVADFFKSPAFTSFASGVGKNIADIFGKIGSTLDNIVKPALHAVENYFKSPAFHDFVSGIGKKILDTLLAIGTFTEQKVIPPLIKFGSYIQTQIVPILMTWGHNIQVYVIDKYNALKAYIETQLMPKLSGFWNYITTQIVPVLISWGTNIKTWVIDKLSDLWSFITTKVMPKLIELWSFVQTQIVSAFSNWGDKIKNVQDKISDFKTFIDTQVIPVLRMIWQWINDHVVPVFQSLWDIVTKVGGNFDGLKTSTGHLMDSLKHLWDVVSPILTPALELLAYTAGAEAGGKFDGLKQVIDVCGDALNLFVKNISMGIDALARIIDWIATAIGWVNSFDDAIVNAAADLLNMVGIQAQHAGTPAPSGGTGGGAVKSFASGIENFGGGFAYVHAGEILTYLPKGSNVYSPSQSANILNGAGLASTGSGLQQQTIHIHNYIDGEQIKNNVGPRIIKSARTNGPLRGGL